MFSIVPVSASVVSISRTRLECAVLFAPTFAARRRHRHRHLTAIKGFFHLGEGASSN